MKARIALEADSSEEAKAISRALNPDNLKAPRGMRISTSTRGAEIVSEIVFLGRIATLTSTIDDILRCARAAERAFKSLSKQ
jgi:tRNA threonylcarbamoyladenosine modification (KEOPS) complex  Pcc1 subunit